ncbi:MAG: phBC6A51 family helix-turn-helix protein [Thermincola sp.]|jgi:AcrR family transcriptional regulator|nr:phBC6A51 family helix-turn-helix protein [Thermincola sp.]MDT3704267.1 phBC6A51 family helix-turn-helix protein [Thermincola sp.]
MSHKNYYEQPTSRLGKKLSIQQRKAAELFAVNDLKCNTVEQIAEEVGVSPRTVYRWKRDPIFIAYQNEVADLAMEDFLSETYGVLKRLVRSGRSDHAKLKAVELVLKNRGKLTDKVEQHTTIEDNTSNEAIEKEIQELKKLLGEITGEEE